MISIEVEIWIGNLGMLSSLSDIVLGIKTVIIPEAGKTF
jgi:hypothetical protein